MEKLNVMERKYGRARWNGKKKDDWKLWQTEKRRTKLERKGPYVIHCRVEVTMDEISRAADMFVHRSSTAGYSSRLVNIFKISTIKRLVFVCEVAAECGWNVSNTELWLAFVMYGYLKEGSIPTVHAADLCKEFVRKPLKHERRVWKLFATSRCEYSNN